MKAIILTGIPIITRHKNLIKNTNVFKLALNGYSEELSPDVRFISDYVLDYIYENFPEPIVTVRDFPEKKYLRVIKAGVEFKGATIISSCEWLYNNNYNNILIVGDNTVHNKTHQNNVRQGIKELSKLHPDLNIFQFKKGNFNLPVKSINKFIQE